MTNDYSLAAALKPLALSVAITTALTGCASIAPSIDNGSDFQRGVYATAGLGASRLNPSVENNPELDVNDRVEPAGQVTLGADLSPTFSVELHSADLGSAGFSPSQGADGSSSAGRYNYHMNGISALAYVGGNKHNANRKGLTGYGRLGYASIENSPVGNLNYSREDEAPVVVGAGIEYATAKGLGLRAEAMTNGSDASYGQVGVMYRLGLGSKKTPKLAQAEPSVKAPVQMPQPAVAAARVPVDSDQDGVMDNIDQCLSSAPGASVDSSGCELISGQIDMVLFDVDSAELTGEARSMLSNVARQMSRQPGATLNLEGHADSTGDADYNLDLSKRRARSVARYLIDSGVSRSQLSDVNSYGEMSPAQENNTVSGRAANRRVEIHGTGFVR